MDPLTSAETARGWREVRPPRPSSSGATPPGGPPPTHGAPSYTRLNARACHRRSRLRSRLRCVRGRSLVGRRGPLGLRYAGGVLFVRWGDVHRRAPGLLPVLERRGPMHRQGLDLCGRRRRAAYAIYAMRRCQRLRRRRRVLPLVQQRNEPDRLSVWQCATRPPIPGVQALVRVPRGKDVQRRHVPMTVTS